MKIAVATRKGLFFVGKTNGAWRVTDAALLKPQQTDLLTSLGPTLHLLATTRLPAGNTTHIRWSTLGELPEADAVALLEKHRSLDDEAQQSWVSLWSEGRVGPARDFMKLLRSCVLLAFFDHPEVRTSLHSAAASRSRTALGVHAVR